MQEEELKLRDMRRVHQSAKNMGLAWDPELEPEFRGPLWESVTAPSANKNQPEKKNINLGASAKAVAAEKDNAVVDGQGRDVNDNENQRQLINDGVEI